MRIRTLNEAAEALGCSRARLRSGVLEGRYPHMMWGNRYLVDLDVVAPIVAAEDAEAAEHPMGLRECAAAIGVSESTLRAMAEDGLVPSTRGRGRWRFRLSEVEDALRDAMKD